MQHDMGNVRTRDLDVPVRVVLDKACRNRSDPATVFTDLAPAGNVAHKPLGSERLKGKPVLIGEQVIHEPRVLPGTEILSVTGYCGFLPIVKDVFLDPLSIDTVQEIEIVWVEGTIAKHAHPVILEFIEPVQLEV